MERISNTVSIHLFLQMERFDETAEFDYNVDVDPEGQIVITPLSDKVSFTHVSPLAGYDSTEDTVDGNIRSFALSLTANMLSGTDSYAWFTDIDDIGQVYITPQDEETSFENASVNGSLNIVEDNKGENESMNNNVDNKNTEQILDEEAVRDVVARQKEEKEKLEKAAKEKKVQAKVEEAIEKVDPREEDGPYSRNDIERELTNLTKNFTVEEDTLRCGYEEEKDYSVELLKQHYGKVDVEEHGAWFHITFGELLPKIEESVTLTEDTQGAAVALSDLEGLLNECQAKLDDLRALITHTNECAEKSVTESDDTLTEDVEDTTDAVEELDTDKIIHRFMTGDVTILPAEKVEDNFVELEGLKYTHGDKVIRYYYNKEADAVAYIMEGNSNEA